MKDCMILGTYNDQDLEWFVLNRHDNIVTLLSRRVISAPLLADDDAQTQDKKISKWLNKYFLPEVAQSSKCHVTLVRQLREEEAKLLLSPDERCACLSDSDTSCTWWNLASHDNKFKVVSDSGQVCTRSVPSLADIRPVIEVILN